MTTPRPGCPQCGGTLRPVPARTVASQTRRALTRAEGFGFCSAPACDVVYAHPERGDVVRSAELPVVVFQKSAAADRLVCYCFGHTAAEVIADAEAPSRAGGSIVDAIADACRQGLGRCETTNPQGRCCLANVHKVATAAGASRLHCGDEDVGNTGRRTAALSKHAGVSRRGP